MTTALRLAFVFWMVCPFPYFMTAGANTFTVPKLLNIGLFVHMANDDERVLLASAIGADYRAYRGRVGMFVPRIRRR